MTVLETLEIMVFITPYGVYFENPVTILPKSVATRYLRRVRGGVQTAFFTICIRTYGDRKMCVFLEKSHN